jgi:hypothetical protein
LPSSASFDAEVLVSEPGALVSTEVSLCADVCCTPGEFDAPVLAQEAKHIRIPPVTAIIKSFKLVFILFSIAKAGGDWLANSF